MPVLQQWVLTSEGLKRIDAYWEGYALGVEIDGREFHQKEAAFERNKVRRNSIHALDITIVEFSVDQVMSTPGYVVGETEANLMARRWRVKRSVIAQHLTRMARDPRLRPAQSPGPPRTSPPPWSVRCRIDRR